MQLWGGPAGTPNSKASDYAYFKAVPSFVWVGRFVHRYTPTMAGCLHSSLLHNNCHAIEKYAWDQIVNSLARRLWIGDIPHLSVWAAEAFTGATFVQLEEWLSSKGLTSTLCCIHQIFNNTTNFELDQWCMNLLSLVVFTSIRLCKAFALKGYFYPI